MAEPTLLIIGESISWRSVNGIDFSHSVQMVGKRARNTWHIGNTRVPRWLYEVVSEMAQKPAQITRDADGKVVLR